MGVRVCVCVLCGVTNVNGVNDTRNVTGFI